MKVTPVDLLIIAAYLVAVAGIGFAVKKRATIKLDSFYLGDRNVPWWRPGLSGCSRCIDIGGTMAMVKVMFSLGLKSLRATRIFLTRTDLLEVSS